MSSFHHLSFQSQLGSLLFSLLLQVITLCLWQARAPAVERPRCAFGLLQPVRSACYVPLLNWFFREFVCFVEFVVKPV